MRPEWWWTDEDFESLTYDDEPLPDEYLVQRPGATFETASHATSWGRTRWGHRLVTVNYIKAVDQWLFRIKKSS